MKWILLALAIVAGLASSAGADEPPAPTVILAQAIETARTIEDAEDRSKTLSIMAAVTGRNGDPSAARALFQESKKILKAPTIPFRDDILKRTAALEAGSWVEAFGKETLAGVKTFMEMHGTASSHGAAICADPAIIDLDGALATARMIGQRFSEVDPEIRTVG